MPKVVFIAADGTPEPVDAAVGASLMRAAVSAGIDGIVADCGGNAMCSTCHVYIPDAAWLPAVLSVEHEGLKYTAAERRPESRLSCQVPVTEEFDGLVITLPDTQE